MEILSYLILPILPKNLMMKFIQVAFEKLILKKQKDEVLLNLHKGIFKGRWNLLNLLDLSKKNGIVYN